MSTLTPEDIEKASDGRYVVQSVVGQGGMGIVYLAHNRELGSRVAIKVLTSDVIFNEARMARFRREAALSAQLSHPNIVPVFELQAFHEAAFLVMPFIDGVSLEQHIRNTGPLLPVDVQSMLKQIGGALSYAHGKGVIHRDVKPANILLERESNRWMLTDFGVAHIAADGITALTATDATIGTLSYMAPEQLGSAREVDARADLYSLALVGCEALLGTYPERDGPHETTRLLTEHGSGIRPEWAKTLTWPLASARDERPPSVATWLERLERKRRGRHRRLLAIATGTAAVATAGVWGLQQRGTSPSDGPTVVAVLPFQIDGSDADLPDLASILPLAITRQVRTLPGYQALNEEAVRTTLQERYGAQSQDINTLLQVANSLSATEAVLGYATVRAGSLTVRVDVYNPASGQLIDNMDVAKQPLDSLHAIVSEAVIGAFAKRLAASFAGVRAPSLPVGLPAIGAYFRGDLAVRRGTLEDAVMHLDRVIEADPSFAPAYLKRALALTYQARPTQATTAIRPAVDRANQNRERLDDVSQLLLDAISTAVYSGNLRDADRQLRNIRGDNPNAVDVRFLLGALQARFPALMNATLIEARRTLNEVLDRDPSFSLAHGLLIQIGALLDDDPRGTRNAILGYLSGDSTSPRAEAARLADTLLFRQAEAPRVVRSFPSRSPLVLENVAQAAGFFDPPGGTRPFAIGAIDALLNGAITDAERAVAGRMRLAAYFGSGDFQEAARFVTRAAGFGIPAAEIDRWIILADVMGLPALADRPRILTAVANLTRTTDDPVLSRWLVARWTRLFDPAATSAADRELQAAKIAAVPDTIDAWAFQLDLRAHDVVDTDPEQALDLWHQATTRYALDRVAFGLVSSRWPIHLDRIRTVAAAGNFSETQTLAAHFRSMTGFIDQMAWYPAFMTLADLARTPADSSAARQSVAGVLRNFVDVTRGDSLRTAWGFRGQ